MFLQEMLANTNKVFARQTDDQRVANTQALNYIHQLSKQSSINISTWDIRSLFGDPTNKKISVELIKNKNEINRIFFGEFERRKVDVSSEVMAATNAIKKQLTAISAGVKASRIDQIKRSIENQEQDLISRTRNLNDRVRAICDLQKEINKITGMDSDDSVMAGLEEVLATGFYQFESVNTTRIIFSTKEELIMSRVNKAAHIDQSLNLGRFFIEIEFNGLVPKVKPLSNNVVWERKYHPYISNTGDVCFGTGEEMASKYRTSFNMAGLLQLLQNILVTYSDSTPYVSFDNLWNSRVALEKQKHDLIEHKKKLVRVSRQLTEQELDF